ncbi:alpha/beta hydrolase [Leifsonia shinshuensis]|uniref:alpha/beta fold hydrolase n=1 Tax=Leifsonia shinshuensis TaxID=150026 RepID=UPI0028670050|nr:alpha/beta hydrolase [Leifsonia shinshuensis]MDR6972902.1 pimeloyl-ACP methyl ester carboxylesterase [Leifsonia shinshuensis]
MRFLHKLSVCSATILGTMKPHTRSRRIKVAAVAAAIAGLLAVAIPAQVSSAAVATKHAATASSTTKPTIVLVHGAWADASSFAPETAALQAAGYTVLAAPNPLRGLETDTKAVADFIQQRTTGPVVLVGHSYGGMVITGAALADPDVKALVYIDAFAPDNNENAQTLTNASPGSLLNVADPSTVFNVVLPIPDAQQADWDSYIRTDKFKSVFAASLPSAVTDVLAAGQSPVTFGALGTPFVGTPAWKTIPSWFVIGTADRLLPPAEQRLMAQRAHGTVTEVNAPHLSMLAKPLQVTKVILDAAHSVH